MKNFNYYLLALRVSSSPLVLVLFLLATGAGFGPASVLARTAGAGGVPTVRQLPRVTAAPAAVLVDYCFTTPDYAFKAETVGPDVTFTFHPLGATVGGSLAIVYIREGATGAYPGYTMVQNGAGDFLFTKAIANGVVTSVYFTYQVGAGGPQRNNATAPHSYTVGTDCTVSASNVPPTVSLTAPATGATFAAPATINLTATAADADGTVSKVEFYQGTTLLGQVLTAPYVFNWTGVIGDSYSLTAKATDNGNASTTSAPVNILVQSSDGYCATRLDYAYSAVTIGSSVAFTFHPLGATVGGNLAIVFIRESPVGAYPGYTMVRNAAGDFTFSKIIAGGAVTSVYFTYQIGAGGPQQTSLTAPHSYTVGTSCRIATATGTKGAALATALTVAPIPTHEGASLAFTTGHNTPYEVSLYNLNGARIHLIGQGRAIGDRAVQLSVPTAELANGIYLVKLVTDDSVVTQRLVVSH